MPISIYGRGFSTQGLRGVPFSFFLSIVLLATSALEAGAQDQVRAFRFVENIGQWSQSTLLMGTNQNALLRFRQTGVDWWYSVSSTSDTTDQGRIARGYGLTTEFVGASPDVEVSGEGEAGAVWNYYLGRGEGEQFTGARDFQSVRYRCLYPQIDAKFYGQAAEGDPAELKGMKYDLIVEPGGRPEEIVIRYSGARGLRIAKDGGLEVVTEFGILREASPYSFQEINGKRVEVSARFRKVGTDSYGFEVGAYDPEYPLTIDPCLAIEYLTFFGGGGFDEVTSMAVDSAGNGYAAGFSRATNFPTVPSLGELTPDNRFFVSKIAPDGSSLIYSSVFGPEYLGTYDVLRDPVSGSILLSLYEALGEDVEVTPDGKAVVGMTTNIPNLTTTVGAYQRNRASNRVNSLCGPPFSDNFDLYLFRLSQTGTMEWGTYLGGNDDDYLRDIAIDPSGNVAITGVTEASRCGVRGDTLTFPVTVPRESFSTTDTLKGFETFVSLLNPNGQNLLFSAYYGGAGNEFASKIAAGPSGDLYILGSTNSNDLKTTPGALQERPNAGLSGNVFDLYVARINPSSATLVYSTYIGDNGGVGRFGLGYGGYVARRSLGLPLAGLTTERGYQGLVLEREGVLLVGGSTRSTTLPIPSGAFQAGPGNPTGDDSTGVDAFILRFDMNANRIVNATYFGGSGFDGLGGLAVDADGNIVVGVATSSTNFPRTRVNVQDRLRGTADAALTLLSPGLNGLEFSTYVGGAASSGARLWEQSVRGVTAGSDGSVYIYGGTVSFDLPLSPNPLKGSNDYHGGWIAKFVASLTPRIGTSLTIDFAPEACNQLQPYNQLIFNSGQTPLRVDSLLFTDGTFYRIINAPAFPFTLGPCDSVTITLGFNPDAVVGPDSAACGDLLRDTLRIISSNASPGEVRVPISGTKTCVSFRLLEKVINDSRYPLGSRRGFNVLAFVGGADQQLTIEPAPSNGGEIALRSPWENRSAGRGVISIDFDVNATDTGQFCGTFYVTAQPCGRLDTITICAYVRTPFFNLEPDSINFGLTGCFEQRVPTKIWNSGNDTLKFRLIFFGGEQYQDIGYDVKWDSIRVLPPGDTFNFNTIYRPRGTGVRTGVAFFETNEILNENPIQQFSAELDSVAFRLSLQSLEGAFGDLLPLPVEYEQLQEGRIPTTEITFFAQFDPNTLEIDDVGRAGTLTDGWEVAESRLVEGGRVIRLVMGSGGKPLAGSGVLANLQMRVLRGDTIASPLDIRLDGVSQFCLTAFVDTGFGFQLSAECLAHERLLFFGNRMLKPIYPNPVRDQLRIPFRVPIDGEVTITLYDAAGRAVAVLLNQEMTEGNNELILDSRFVPPGHYFCRMTANQVLTDVREVVIER
ncbi:MAG: T9SS type A sorting domain-containing protein [Candidatus Kapaibacterium sp.]